MHAFFKAAPPALHDQTPPPGPVSQFGSSFLQSPAPMTTSFHPLNTCMRALIPRDHLDFLHPGTVLRFPHPAVEAAMLA
jgi:hypothetical protein